MVEDDWDEIYDPGLAATVRVDKNAVLIKTKERLFSITSTHYILQMAIGADVLKALNWTTSTKVKFQWGKNASLGMLRVAAIVNELAGGWNLKICKAGYASVNNKALPKDIVNKIERIDVELQYSIVEDSRETACKILELRLPDDFYLSGPAPQLVKPVLSVGNISAPTPAVTFDNQPKIDLSKAPQPEIELPPLRPLPPPKVKTPPPPHQPQRTHILAAKSTDKMAAALAPTQTDDSKREPLTVYDKAVANGGPISIHDLCRWLKIYNGDQASVIGQLVEINDVQMNQTKALAYANDLRVKANKPIFSLRN